MERRWDRAPGCGDGVLVNPSEQRGGGCLHLCDVKDHPLRTCVYIDFLAYVPIPIFCHQIS